MSLQIVLKGLLEYILSSCELGLADGALWTDMWVRCGKWDSLGLICGSGAANGSLLG